MTKPIGNPERDNGRVGGGKRDIVKAADIIAAETEDVTEDRAETTVALRMAGASWAEIAQVQEYASAAHALAAFEKAMATTASNPDKREVVKALHTRRLDRLLKAIWTKAINPRDPDQLAYHREALAVMDRYARFHGLDAPTQVAVYTPNAKEIEDVVARFQVLSRAETEATEADIMDADIVPDDED